MIRTFNKYPKVTGWWVYVIKTPDNMYYPGCSGRKYVCSRCNISGYRGTALYSYIEQFGWENLEKVVLIDDLTKEQALQWEERLICMYQELGCCINKQRSGGNGKERWEKEKRKSYSKQYYDQHKDEQSKYHKQYYQEHCEEIKEKSRLYQKYIKNKYRNNKLN